MNNKQYLNKDQLNFDLNLDDIKLEDLVSKDSYDESLLFEEFTKLKKPDRFLLLKATIQMALIGFGQQSYGSIMIEGKEVEIITIFKRLGVKYNMKQNEKYTPTTFSARRLLRLFRYEIQKYIEKTQRASYLFRKYDDVKDNKMMSFIFPGGEHLVETTEQATYLYKVYSKLDELNKTSIVEKLKRVLDARNISINI
jgi:hypothetical protein